MRVPEPERPSGPGAGAMLAPTARRDFPAIAALALQAAVLLAMTASVATKVWQDHIWFGFLLVGITVAVWAPEFRLRRERLWWFSYVAGIFIYTLLRAVADESFIPVRAEYVISLDSWLPGKSPVVWMQELRAEHNFPGLVDYLGIAVHWSFFIAPHAGAVAVFVYRRTAFPAYVALLVGTMWLGLLLFFVLPTMPPWLAAQHGELPGVTRVMDSTIRESLAGDDSAFPGGVGTYDEFYRALGEPNSVAAMPSIHMAVTFGMALWAWRYARRWAPWLLAYTALMGVALAYLGEHYVADELAGLACAGVVWALVLRSPLARPAQAAR